MCASVTSKYGFHTHTTTHCRTPGEHEQQQDRAGAPPPAIPCGHDPSSREWWEGTARGGQERAKALGRPRTLRVWPGVGVGLGREGHGQPAHGAEVRVGVDDHSELADVEVERLVLVEDMYEGM